MRSSGDSVRGRAIDKLCYLLCKVLYQRSEGVKWAMGGVTSLGSERSMWAKVSLAEDGNW